MAVDVEVVLGQNLGALVDGATGTVEDSTQHVLGHTELERVAAELDFGLLDISTTACILDRWLIRRTFLTSIPEVPSKTCCHCKLHALVIPGGQSQSYGDRNMAYLDDGTVACIRICQCAAPRRW